MSKAPKSKRNGSSKKVQKGLPNAGEQYALAASKGAKAVFQLVPGTQNFAQALHDPFSTIGMQVKMPILPVLDTQTVVNYVQDLEWSSGVNGVGYVMLAPAYGMAGALPSVVYTTQTNTLAAGDPIALPAPGNGVLSASLTSQYAFPNFTNDANGLRGRIVGAGIEITCLGSALITQGVYHTLAHPNKESLIGSSHNDLGGYLQTRIDNVIDTKGGPHTVRVTRPILNASDTRYLWYYTGGPTAGFAYDDVISTATPTLTDDNNYWMGITVAVSQNGFAQKIPFRARVFVVTEVYGKIMAAVASRAIVDQPGYDAVVAHHASVTHNPLADMRLRVTPGARTAHPGFRNTGSMLADLGRWVMRNQSGVRMVAGTLANAAKKAAPLLLG